MHKQYHIDIYDSKRYLSLIIFFIAACIISYAQGLNNCSNAMRHEADIFLANLPIDLQQRQAEAVEAAIKGDSSSLDVVRNSRNSSPMYSADITVEDFCIHAGNGREIPLRLYSPADNRDTLPLLIYFHGGGWTFGSLNSCARYCDALCTSANAKVLAVDYALAPEHPYPEGLNDCITAVEYAVENHKELGVDINSISVGGDSSGGNLALATALSLIHSGTPVLKSIVLYYPVLKAETDNSESWQEYGTGFGLDSNLMDIFNRAYCSESHEKKSATVSPAYASDSTLKELPPLLLINAERDILTGQGCAFAERMAGLGCSIKHIVFPGAVHLFITVPGQPAAFQKSIEYTAQFIGCHN